MCSEPSELFVGKLQCVCGEHSFFPSKLIADLWISVVVVEDAVLVSQSAKRVSAEWITLG